MKIKVGQIYPSKSCGKFEVVHIESYKKMRVRFLETGYEVNVQGGQVTDGRVSDKLSPTVYRVGILGDIDFRIQGVKSYKIWNAMLQRCYSEESQRSGRNSSYRGITVHKDWHYYLNFKEWFDKNYIEGYYLDKDLTIIGSTEYSKETCCFVPNKVNCLLIHPKLSNTGNYPVGVHLDSESGRYAAQVSMQGSRRKWLGYYSTPEEAFKVYKDFKENLIKRVAQECYDCGEINGTIYNNLMRYEVEPF